MYRSLYSYICNFDRHNTFAVLKFVDHSTTLYNSSEYLRRVEGRNMACLRDSLGLPSLKGMVEGRRIKFLDKLLVCDGATVIVQTYVNNLASSYIVFKIICVCVIVLCALCFICLSLSYLLYLMRNIKSI